jgi:hypothetical protein
LRLLPLLLLLLLLLLLQCPFLIVWIFQFSAIPEDFGA